MTNRDRALLKRLARRLHTDADFLRAVVAEPTKTLAGLKLRPSQISSVVALALMLNGGALADQALKAGVIQKWW